MLIQLIHCESFTHLNSENIQKLAIQHDEIYQGFNLHTKILFNDSIELIPEYVKFLKSLPVTYPDFQKIQLFLYAYNSNTTKVQENLQYLLSQNTFTSQEFQILEKYDGVINKSCPITYIRSQLAFLKLINKKEYITFYDGLRLVNMIKSGVEFTYENIFAMLNLIKHSYEDYLKNIQNSPSYFSCNSYYNHSMEEI